jgi:flavin reductase (DIM6/NTAB) family NADH-FMN oxidoreductase RutF
MSRPAVDAAAFKGVMRHHPAGVTVVTSVHDGEPRGITLSSFASVSANPPLVLVCVNREARSYLYIASSRIYCVNLLSAEQRELAQRFAGGVKERQFDDVPHTTGTTGAPILAGTIGFLDCEVTEELHAGSHSIFVARVVDCDARPGTPLGYFNGSFHDFEIRVE